MFPGGRGMNPKQMEAMMRRMGISTETVDATEVIIKKRAGKIILKDPSVTIMTVQGEKTYQITGREVLEGSKEEATRSKKKKKKKKTKEETEVREEEPKPEPTGPVYAEEDVQLVMDQTGCTEEQARKALHESDGQPAEAILRLMS